MENNPLRTFTSPRRCMSAMVALRWIRKYLGQFPNCSERQTNEEKEKMKVKRRKKREVQRPKKGEKEKVAKRKWDRNGQERRRKGGNLFLFFQHASRAFFIIISPYLALSLFLTSRTSLDSRTSRIYHIFTFVSSYFVLSLPFTRCPMCLSFVVCDVCFETIERPREPTWTSAFLVYLYLAISLDLYDSHELPRDSLPTSGLRRRTEEESRMVQGATWIIFPTSFGSRIDGSFLSRISINSFEIQLVRGKSKKVQCFN